MIKAKQILSEQLQANQDGKAMDDDAVFLIAVAALVDISEGVDLMNSWLEILATATNPQERQS